MKDYETLHDVIDALKPNPSFVQQEQENVMKHDDWIQDNIDEETSYPFDPLHEARRLMTLKSYNLLDTNNHDPQYEEITRLAQSVFDCPIAMVTIVDMGRLWLKEIQGLPDEVIQVPRAGGLCAHALQRQHSEGLLIVNDTLEDERFQNYPLVTGGPKVRFYAAAPLVSPEGQRLGVVAIVDQKPRPNGLTYHQCDTLLAMADLVVYNIIVDADE